MHSPYRQLGTPRVCVEEARARDRLLLEMGPEEQLVWVGWPRRGIALAAEDRLMVPSLLCLIALQGIAQAVATHASEGFRMGLQACGFLAVCAALARYLCLARRRDHSVYGISTRRVLLAFEDSTTSVPLEDTGNASLTEAVSGSSTLWLTGAHRSLSEELSAAVGARPQLPALFCLESGRSVYDVLARARHTRLRDSKRRNLFVDPS